MVSAIGRKLRIASIGHMKPHVGGEGCIYLQLVYISHTKNIAPVRKLSLCRLINQHMSVCAFSTLWCQHPDVITFLLVSNSELSD
jgi:hypothetical protein